MPWTKTVCLTARGRNSRRCKTSQCQALGDPSRECNNSWRCLARFRMPIPPESYEQTPPSVRRSTLFFAPLVCLRTPHTSRLDLSLRRGPLEWTFFLSTPQKKDFHRFDGRLRLFQHNVLTAIAINSRDSHSSQLGDAYSINPHRCHRSIAMSDRETMSYWTDQSPPCLLQIAIYLRNLLDEIYQALASFHPTPPTPRPSVPTSPASFLNQR